MYPPNSSSAITNDAIGVFVPPQNTPIIPNAAKNDIGRFTIRDKRFPKVAPITNNGVTSPPWKPVDKVIDVRISFIIKEYLITGLVNEFLNKSKLKPN